MTEDGRLLHDPHAAQVAADRIDVQEHFGDVIHVTLRVDAARDGEAHEFEVGRAFVPSGWRPNMTEPISAARMPPSR